MGLSQFSKYTLRRYRRSNPSSLFGYSHGSDDFRYTLCGTDMEVRNFRALTCNFEGEVNCPKCLKVLEDRLLPKLENLESQAVYKVVKSKWVDLTIFAGLPKLAHCKECHCIIERDHILFDSEGDLRCPNCGTFDIEACPYQG